MSSDSFVFKRFTVYQDRSAHKVGTDAVLLGAWADPKDATHILDIGTGTGIIALMMGQKSNAQIDAIEVDGGSYSQAEENFRYSPWSNRLHAIYKSLQGFKEGNANQYDLIITNPPYFIDSMKAQDEERKKARHTDTLPFDDLIKGVMELLSAKGRFSIILPKKEAETFRKSAESSGLHLNKLLRVFTKEGLDIEKRHLMLFRKEPSEFSESRITLETINNQYTKEYIDLTKDFYLNF